MLLSPLEAANRVNEQVTVEMLVKAAKNCPDCSQIFLDSEEDHRDPNNLAVAVTEIGEARFKAAGIDDPARYFKGKTIRVTGVVTLKDNRPRIEVVDPGQINVLQASVSAC
jgi:DNA/RNA endonuclease YhcR with UshA esterase domain